jgi:uncharacterized membrane protein HdeD (DUF308 family)
MSIAAADRSGLWSGLRSKRSIVLWSGWGLAILGLAAMVAPKVGHLIIGVLAGWLLWLAGAVMLAVSLVVRVRPFAAGVVSGLAAIAAGIFLLFNPTVGALAVTILAAAVFIVDGAFQLALALDLRPLKAWRWVLASALASGLAALVMGLGLPKDSPPTFGLIAGFAVWSSGVALIALSDAAKKTAARDPA